MDSSQTYELVGGITSLVLIYAYYDNPDSTRKEYATDVNLNQELSSYSELVTVCNSGKVVTHTLSFVIEHNDSFYREWMFDLMVQYGVYARITLATGAQIVAGWSEVLGGDFPLRLVSSEFVSGEKPIDYPLRRLTFRSVDRIQLI